MRPGDSNSHGAKFESIRVAALLACLALGASACASQEETGTIAHRVKVWESGTTYSADVAVVKADVGRVQNDLSSHAKSEVVEFDCVTLGQDVNMDYGSTLPTPDQAFSTDLGNAYQAYLQYASDCVQHKGAAATTTADAHYLTTGNQDLAAAQARSKAILG